LTDKKPSPEVIVNDSAASSPVWLDDVTILYISTKNGESSLRTFNIATNKDHKVHSFVAVIGDLKAFTVNKTTTRIAFSTKVDAKGKFVRANETETPEALVYDRLWVRHWDEWITSHKMSIFSSLVISSSNGYTLSGLHNMINSTDEVHRMESPTPPFGGEADFSVGEELMAFVAKDPHLNPALNTAAHVYVVKYNDSRYLEKVNRGPGASSSPVWSSDGQYLAYLEMRIRGYETDRTSPWLQRLIEVAGSWYLNGRRMSISS
jgi:hypothetical protein